MCVLGGPPLGPGGEDITSPDQVAPWGQKVSSTRKIKPQTSNLVAPNSALQQPCLPLARTCEVVPPGTLGRMEPAVRCSHFLRGGGGTPVRMGSRGAFAESTSMLA